MVTSCVQFIKVAKHQITPNNQAPWNFHANSLTFLQQDSDQWPYPALAPL